MQSRPFAKPIVTDSIENGLDRKGLKDLARRLEDINNERLKNIREALSDRHKPFLDVLPLLLHTNHPLLPGYLSHKAPAGIIHYKPSEQSIKTAKIFGRSFTYNTPQNDPFITAVFLMGSVGTIAYTANSDLDVWVCYKNNLHQDDIDQLNIKCSLIEEWADKIGLETHFFTMNASDFSKGNNKQLSNESSGSSQHFLLLDEFYRSAISLAGQTPSWWYVPSNCHDDYDNYLNILLTKRYIAADKILDFGVIPSIPENEFLSAGIWQLYKAIEAPYKSLLKLFLLESYSNPSLSEKTVSKKLKTTIYSGSFKFSDLDPYIMSYRFIEEYLTERKEHDRLHLIRRCLYFKINKPLTKPITHKKISWQREILESLVKEWEWSKSYLKHLDNRHKWKAADVIEEKKLIVEELNRSYSFLQSLSTSNNIKTKNLEKTIDNASREELEILQRKLNAYYATAEGKIDNINANISLDLSEPFVTFVEKYDKATDEYFWSIYPERIIDQNDYRQATSLKKSSSVIELILWSYFNYLLTDHTYIDCHRISADISKEVINQLITHLKHWKPLPLPMISHESYQQSSYVTHMTMIINADQQPKSRTINKGIHHITGQSDILNRGLFNETLLKTIDLVTIDNWNIIRNIHLTGNCLTACLSYFLSNFHQNIQEDTSKNNVFFTPAFSVQCLTPTVGMALQQRITQLFSEIYESLNSNHLARYVFTADNHFYSCEIKDNEPLISSIKNDTQLMRYLSLDRDQPSPIFYDSHLQSNFPLHLIAPLSHDQAIHLIYSLRGQDASIYLLDERGSLFVSQLSAFNEQTLLRPLHFFIRSTLKRLKLTNTTSKNNFDVYPVKFYRYDFTDNGDDFLNPNLAISDVSDLPFYNVAAVLFEELILIAGEKYKKLAIEIKCGNTSFASAEYGDNVFFMAAQHIVSQRESREIYPCYITDIDLSDCSSILQSPSLYALDSYYSEPLPLTEESTQDLQLIHYFAAKSFIERQLNTALFALPTETLTSNLSSLPSGNTK